ncbi:MAG: hypothetical protein AVDCRST_MAG67-2621 [uncultured Solirubrobacteraceae bacterium]|uniref:Uncharacterized protein n=1 Tax=uncultured Solirubrobacteraceae bacterium TaxID=1162706 RepID=A0A6J4SYS8_9ACTN|nr:MAG: hypothetical protein AVDCRST_MAG67-2621 [uncultured Solirubrobacteraceae bacterium]
MAYKGLEVYLTDHLAGATAGVNLARMAAQAHRSHEHGAFFGEIASEISADFDTLEQLLAQLGVKKSATKTAAAEIGSKLMAPKFVGGDDDELNAFITLETLYMGIEGKVSMWKALKTVEDAYPTLAGYDLDELIARGESQRERIEEARLRVAPQALAHTATV